MLGSDFPRCDTKSPERSGAGGRAAAAGLPSAAGRIALAPHAVNLTKHWAATLEDYVIDLAWSPDGSLLAGAAASGPVTVFAAADGARRHGLPGHDDGTNCLGTRWLRKSAT